MEDEQLPPPISYAAEQIPEYHFLEGMSDFLDNRFRIPGTKIRFGFDALLGLFPYIGDIATFIVSGFLVGIMARRGASGMVLVKMVWNILVDGLVGTVPFLGDIFDIAHKANTRNVRLLQEHYTESKHMGSAWWVILLLLLSIVGLIALSVFIVWRLVQLLGSLIN